MEIYLKNRAGTVNARASYDPESGIVILKAGSIISKTLSKAPTFRSRNSMERKRLGYVENGVLLKDIVFSSLSTAATFAYGANRDGWITWKNAEGKSMAKLFKK